MFPFFFFFYFFVLFFFFSFSLSLSLSLSLTGTKFWIVCYELFIMSASIYLLQNGKSKIATRFERLGHGLCFLSAVVVLGCCMAVVRMPQHLRAHCPQLPPPLTSPQLQLVCAWGYLWLQLAPGLAETQLQFHISDDPSNAPDVRSAARERADPGYDHANAVLAIATQVWLGLFLVVLTLWVYMRYAVLERLRADWDNVVDVAQDQWRREFWYIDFWNFDSKLTSLSSLAFTDAVSPMRRVACSTEYQACSLLHVLHAYVHIRLSFFLLFLGGGA